MITHPKVPRPALLLAGLSVAALAAVTACGSSSSGRPGNSTTSATASSVAAAAATPSSAGKATSPCDLVTAADVSKVMGGPTGASQFNDAGISALCSYASANQTDDDSEYNVGITLVKDTESKSDFEDFPGVTVTHVSGVGDDALWEADKTTLYVLKSGKVIEVSIGGPSDALTARAQSLATQLAQIAVTRL